jgi:hypothetical protein
MITCKQTSSQANTSRFSSTCFLTMSSTACACRSPLILAATLHSKTQQVDQLRYYTGCIHENLNNIGEGGHTVHPTVRSRSRAQYAHAMTDQPVPSTDRKEARVCARSGEVTCRLRTGKQHATGRTFRIPPPKPPKDLDEDAVPETKPGSS